MYILILNWPASTSDLPTMCIFLLSHDWLFKTCWELVSRGHIFANFISLRLRLNLRKVDFKLHCHLLSNWWIDRHVLTDMFHSNITLFFSQIASFKMFKFQWNLNAAFLSVSLNFRLVAFVNMGPGQYRPCVMVGVTVYLCILTVYYFYVRHIPYHYWYFLCSSQTRKLYLFIGVSLKFNIFQRCMLI